MWWDWTNVENVFNLKTRMSLAECPSNFSDSMPLSPCGQTYKLCTVCCTRKTATSQCSGLLWIKQLSSLHKLRSQLYKMCCLSTFSVWTIVLNKFCWFSNAQPAQRSRTITAMTQNHSSSVQSWHIEKLWCSWWSWIRDICTALTITFQEDAPASEIHRTVHHFEDKIIFMFKMMPSTGIIIVNLTFQYWQLLFFDTSF